MTIVQLTPVVPAALSRWSYVIRVLASINVALMFACLMVGKHDLFVPSETPLSMTIPFWVFPSSCVLILVFLFRILSSRERAKGHILTDAAFVFVSLIFLIGFDMSMAGL